MTRKHTRRKVVVPLPPRGLRPRLAGDQVRDLALVHLVNLDAVARGEGTPELLWQMVGGALTWSRVAESLGAGVPETSDQLLVLEAVIERYKRTGRIGFSGAEYQRAKHAVDVMDELARLVDRPTAVAAAEWSEARVNAIAEQCRREREEKAA
jgi:hypothetical protein